MRKSSRHEASRTKRGMRRRDFLRTGVLGMLGLTLGDLLKLEAYGAPTEGKAKSVIWLWMGGGPPHLDTFDPKPGAGPDYTGPYTKAIPTNVPGIQLCQTMPMMAKIADKYAIIRGMTHHSNGHETAAYMMLTGTMPSDEMVYPSIGSVVALKKGYEGDYKGVLPPFIAVTQPPGRFNMAGFLPNKCRPFATGGYPSSPSFRVSAIVPAAGMTDERLKEREALLQDVDTLGRELRDDTTVAEMDAYQKKAYSLITGDAKKAFDLSGEKKELQDRYGQTGLGRMCLLARRLVENDVPFITVSWGGWDTHKKHFETMDKKLPELDQAFSALLEDLDQRGLLETTIVFWGGEFSGTPKVAQDPPWGGGRHHFCSAFSVVVAGGGFKGGKVVGETDRTGEKVVKRPVYPWDLSASIYKLLGIDPNGRLPHPRGRVVYVTPPTGGTIASGGMLTEIM